MTEQQRTRSEKEMDKLFKKELRKFIKENPDFMKDNVLGCGK